MKGIAAALALCCGWLFAQTQPLLLQNAAQMSGMRSQGELVLRGAVKFRHDSSTFTTELARWNQNLDQVNCTGGFRFVDPGGSLSAESGVYDRRNETAMAQGAAQLRDSADLIRLSGDRIVYDRRTSFATAEGHPRLVAIEADTRRPPAGGRGRRSGRRPATP